MPTYMYILPQLCLPQNITAKFKTPRLTNYQTLKLGVAKLMVCPRKENCTLQNPVLQLWFFHKAVLSLNSSCKAMKVLSRKKYSRNTCTAVPHPYNHSFSPPSHIVIQISCILPGSWDLSVSDYITFHDPEGARQYKRNLAQFLFRGMEFLCR